tara:strand:+ start:52 stop:552 length:501 start_codon:yes stop_codon:yes gene_type:complete
MALTAWGKKDREDLKISELKNESLSQENQLLKLQLMIAGKGGSPGQPYDDPSKEKGPFVPAPPRDKLMIAHGEGRGPQPMYHDEYNQPLNMPPWIQMNPSGELIEIPWMKEQYLQEHPELQTRATSRQIRDRLKPFTKGTGYDDAGGSLRGIPDSLRIQLLRDAMA